MVKHFLEKLNYIVESFIQGKEEKWSMEVARQQIREVGQIRNFCEMNRVDGEDRREKQVRRDVVMDKVKAERRN